MSQTELEDSEPGGIKLPYIPSRAAVKVEQFASKRKLSYKEAYAKVINLVLDEEGCVKDD